MVPNKTSQIITGLKKLKRNWDGNSSPPVSVKTLAKLKAIVGDVEKCGMPFPAIVAVPGGGAVLMWSSGNRKLSMELTPSGKVHFNTHMRVIKDEEEREITSDGVAMSAASIDGLLAWFLSGESFSA